MNETLRSIKNRRSIRVYKPEQIQDSELNAIVEAGLYAPSAMNAQPWHLTVIQNPDILNAINTDSLDGMRKDGSEYFTKFLSSPAFDVFYHAPTVVVVSGSGQSPFSANDCAAVAENLLIAAESLNIGSCWVGLARFALHGEKADHYRKTLQIPDDYSPMAIVALGYKKTSATGAPDRKPNSVNYVK